MNKLYINGILLLAGDDMKRKFYNTLLEWKEDENKKPLMVIGARQVGKTYIIDKFCKEEYKNYVYLNFDKDEELISIFESTKDPKKILESIEIIYNVSINIENTIIFLDEIQICENAINSLKYFCESKDRYNIICAGSLLGVKLNRYTSSFPVGKVRIENLNPMDFEEFMMAIGEDKLIFNIKECFDNNIPMIEALHLKALDLYRKYLCVGGMPASILEFLNCNMEIINFIGKEKEDIITSYIADMAKYTTSTEAIKIHDIYKGLSRQLSKENKKFKYQLINSNARSREYSTPMEWLVQSEIVLRCNMIVSPKIPLEGYKDDSIFKIYFNDIGLFVTHSKTPLNEIILNTNMLYKGAIAENYVAQTLKSKKYELYYFKIDNKLEVDFLIYKDDGVIPIEVKASDNTRSTSLNNYIKMFNPKYAIRISTKNFGFENNIKSIPLYAAFLI